MKKSYSNISRINKMLTENANRRMTLENLIMDDGEYDEYNDGEDMGFEGTEMVDIQSEGNNGNTKELIDNIRQIALQGVSSLASNVTDPMYEVFKKIWNICDSSVNAENKKKQSKDGQNGIK